MTECLLQWCRDNQRPDVVEVWCRKHQLKIGEAPATSWNADTPALFADHQEQIQRDRENAG